MKKLLFLSLFAALFLGLMAPANAAIVNVDVTDDGYLPKGMGGWYMDTTYAKSYNKFYNFYCYGFSRFDIENDLYDAGWRADNIKSATFKFEIIRKAGAGPTEYPAPGDPGYPTTGAFDVHAYDLNGDGGTVPLYMTEAYAGTEKPGYASPLARQYHTPSGYPDDVDFVGKSLESAYAMGQIVQDWLSYLDPAGIGGYYNNGMEIFDTIEDDYGWYWNTKEAGFIRPYLEVETTGAPVPIPGAIYLLGSGLIALVGLRRRKA